MVVIALICAACASDESDSVSPNTAGTTDGGASGEDIGLTTADSGPALEADGAGVSPDDVEATSDDGGTSPDTGDGPIPDVPEPSGDATGSEENGWPSNPSKDSIPDPGWDSVPGVGTVMPNFTAIDQYGQETELYDFAGQGVPVVIDVGTWFCEPCKALAYYLSTGDPSPFYEDNDEDGKVDFLWWNESYEIVYDMVQNGELIWITVLYSLGDPVSPEDVFLWHEEWPSPYIPVLADTTLQLQEYLDVGAMPRIDVLNENMIFEVFETGGPSTGMKYISALP